MEEKNHGGKRIGSGRKPIDTLEKKLMIILYVKNGDIAKFGGKAKIALKLNEFISEYGKENATTIENKPVSTPKTSWDEYLPAEPKIKPPIALKSVEQYIKERLDMDTPEQYDKWITELENDPNLSIKQKSLAKTGRLT